MLTYALRLAAFVDTVAQTVAAHRPSDNLKIARYKDQISRELKAPRMLTYADIARYKDQISRELKAFDNQQPYQQVLSLLALLVQKYKY